MLHEIIIYIYHEVPTEWCRSRSIYQCPYHNYVVSGSPKKMETQKDPLKK